jgi:predicted ribonuclease YlaK
MRVMRVMVTMPVVQEMQHWAEEHQQIGQDAKQMRGVLRDQEESADGEKGEQHRGAP